MRLTIFGSGYVGLVTGACFAEAGNNVLCVDVDERKVEMLQRGESPIFEPGLDEMLKRNIEAGRIRFTTTCGSIRPVTSASSTRPRASRESPTGSALPTTTTSSATSSAARVMVLRPARPTSEAGSDSRQKPVSTTTWPA